MGKRVYFLTLTLTGGGAERVVSNLSRYLTDDIEFNVVLLDGKKISYSYNGNLYDLDISIKRNPIIQLLKGIYSSYNMLKGKGSKTVVSFLDIPNLINIFLKSEKTILSVRNFKSKRVGGLYGKLHKIIINLFYNKSDCIVAVSKGVKNDLVKKFGINEDKIKVIYNPCDIEKIKKSSKEKLSNSFSSSIFRNQDPIVANVGSLRNQKGQWHLIRSFSQVRNKIPEAKLILIGQGRLKNHLKNLTKKLNLEQNVFFLGFQDNPFKFLSRSDLFVLSSLWEGLPNVILESMACELPIVSTDCRSGPREILAPDTDYKKEIRDEIEYAKHGILTPVPDGTKYESDQPLTKEEKLLAKSIIQVLGNKNLKSKYVSQSKKRVKDFQPEKIAKQWVNLIK